MDLRGSLVDGEDAGGELPEASEPDVELAPIGQVHAFKPPAQLSSETKGKIIDLQRNFPEKNLHEYYFQNYKKVTREGTFIHRDTGPQSTYI